MRSKRKVVGLTRKVVSTLSAILLTSHAIAASVPSNHTTSVSQMVDAGWSCLVGETEAYDLNDANFDTLYNYLEARAIRNGIRAEHVVCELGEPSIDRKTEKNLSIMGYENQPGEHILVYGTNAALSSEEQNILVVFIRPNGLARQLLWITPNTQSLAGVRIDAQSKKVTKFNATYKLGDNDVLSK